MSLGAGAIQGWWGPCANTRHSREVPWQPCEREPASPASGHQPAPSHWRNFSGNLPNPIPTTNHFLRGWDGGWGQNWQNRQPKQQSTTLNWASKLQVWWPSSDPFKVVICKDQRSRQLQLWRLGPKAHDEASPCATPQIPGDLWMHWLEINFA